MGLNMRSEGYLNRTTILWPGIPKWGWQNRIISCQCDIHCELLVLHSFDSHFRSDLSMWPTVDQWVQRKRQSVYEPSGLCPKKEKSIAGRKATINWSINVYTLWPERQIIINRVQESSSSEGSFNWALLQILDCPVLNWVDMTVSFQFHWAIRGFVKNEDRRWQDGIRSIISGSTVQQSEVSRML